MDFAGHVSRCKPGSQGCWIGKGSKESFRGRLDKFRVTRAGCFVRICHGRLLSQSRRQWSSIIIRAFSSGVNLKRNKAGTSPGNQRGATIDPDFGAGDTPGGVRDQEKDKLCNILGCSRFALIKRNIPLWILYGKSDLIQVALLRV